jgi:hypothetical protein
MSKRLPIVEVIWVDSAFNRGWGERESKTSAMGTSECRTAGYLLYKDDKVIKIAMTSADGDVSVGDGMSIPMGCVSKVKVIAR